MLFLRRTSPSENALVGEFRVAFLLFLLVFTVLRTAVNSDFFYLIPRGCHGHPAVTCSVFGPPEEYTII